MKALEAQLSDVTGERDELKTKLVANTAAAVEAFTVVKYLLLGIYTPDEAADMIRAIREKYDADLDAAGKCDATS